MRRLWVALVAQLALSAVLALVPVRAYAGQATPTAPAGPSNFCGQTVPPPRALPPEGSGPVVYLIGLCFEAQGGTSLIDAQTYLYYIQLKPSRPSEGVWIPYDEAAEQTIRDDFRRLWNTNFLDNLWIDATDYVFSNGVVGKLVSFNMEERQRVKIVDFVGSKKVERTKIDEKLKEGNAIVRLDTFIDPGLVRKVEGIVRDLMREKGFQYANVTHDIADIGRGPKLVHLTFRMDEGPNVQIRRVRFVGNKAYGNGILERKIKGNRQRHVISFLTGRGTYQEAKFEEDAERLMEFYRNQGYVRINVGEPQLRVLNDSEDAKKRFVELRIPVAEGNRYKVGDFTFTGNTVVKTDGLRGLFKLKTGEFYNQKRIREGLQKAQEVYGSVGYFEFTGYPDFKYRDDPGAASGEAPLPDAARTAPKGPAVVDVTLQVQEGKQYFVNRITFIGNTTTHDNVIRRELRLFEDGIFNTESLKYSVRRLNQLGYFKPLEEGKDVSIDKTPGVANKVDVKVKLEEQNRNQLTFGAGVSQFEGFFGQLSFQTSNFLGRGESLTLSLQGGSRAQNYSLGFTEPFLFDRNITGGLNLFRQDIRYISQFTQQTTGGVLTLGFPVGRGFTRMFTNYSYQRTQVKEVNTLYNDPLVLARNPFLRDSLLIGRGGERTTSKVSPSLVYNTVDQPIFPTQGKRLTAALDLAGLGGNTNYYKPMMEGTWFVKQNARMTFGVRGQVEYIQSFTGQELPIFEKLFLGGEYSVRGFDLRTIGPSDPDTGLVLGGNKSLLFNVEQAINIAGPVRLIFFYDAGQVQDVGRSFSWKEDLIRRTYPDLPILRDPLATIGLTDPSLHPVSVAGGQGSAFKTSTGAEIRFFMPVLNVPFRLIFAYNAQRANVLDNQLLPQKAFQFRFAVGTTF